MGCLGGCQGGVSVVVVVTPLFHESKCNHVHKFILIAIKSTRHFYSSSYMAV